MESSKKTGNESVADIDPGGTRPAPGKSGKKPDQKIDLNVETGDRNAMDPENKPGD